MADEADAFVGFAQLIADANGLASASHVREKISEMIIHASPIRASLEAAVSHCSEGAHGAVFPDELFTNAGKYHGAANYGLMVRHLHDIAGGLGERVEQRVDTPGGGRATVARLHVSARFA